MRSVANVTNEHGKWVSFVDVERGGWMDIDGTAILLLVHSFSVAVALSHSLRRNAVNKTSLSIHLRSRGEKKETRKRIE